MDFYNGLIVMKSILIKYFMGFNKVLFNGDDNTVSDIALAKPSNEI